MSTRIILAAALALAGCGKPATAPESTSAAPSESEIVAETTVSETLPSPAPSPSIDLTPTIAGAYALDKTHGYLTFSYDHMGYSHPTIRWGDWNATLNWDPAAPANSSIDVTINTASIDSGVAALNEQLATADFLDIATFPTISFKSSSVEMTGGDTGKVSGDLTIKGVTRPVTLDIKINKAANDDFVKSYKLGFSGSTTFKRSEFGIDKYVPVVSDDVAVKIEAEFQLPRQSAQSQ